MNIQSTLTIDDIHKLIDAIILSGDNPTVDDILLVVANAAANRAVRDLIDMDDTSY